jgi:hypothetical protein
VPQKCRYWSLELQHCIIGEMVTSSLKEHSISEAFFKMGEPSTRRDQEDWEELASN